MIAACLDTYTGYWPVLAFWLASIFMGWGLRSMYDAWRDY